MMRIVFLCTGNSARSQMAEGWARRLGGKDLHVFSAGTAPAPAVNSNAVEVMAEVGIDLTGHYPKLLSDVPGPIDRIIAVCAHAAENCPVPPSGAVVERWDLPDPAGASGSREEALEVFRSSRDEIERRVRDLMVRMGS